MKTYNVGSIAYTKSGLVKGVTAWLSAVLLLSSMIYLPAQAMGEPDTAVTQAIEESDSTSNMIKLTASVEDASPYTNKLEENTRQILLKLIELERYNLHYRQIVAKQERWKGWRYFTSQEANALTSLGGYITGTVERSKNLITFKKNVRQVLESGNVATMVGQIIGATGSAGEFSINAWHELQTHQKGYAPAAARKRVLALRQEIDTLLTEREGLVKNMVATGGSTKYAAVATAEEQVLLDMRDLSVGEFEQFHVSARRLLAFQQTLYILDVARNVTGAVASRMGWAALRTDNRHYNETAGILMDVSGVLTVLNPLISRGVGKAVGEYNRHYVRACVAGTKAVSEDKLEQDVANMKQLASDPYLEHADLPVIRAAMYGEHQVGVRKQNALHNRELHADVLVAAENVVSGAVIGGTKITGGILFNVAGASYRKSARKTNTLLFCANVLGVVGNTYAAVENLRIQVNREKLNHKLSKDGQLPGQIIKERLAKLDAMEKSLNNQTINNRISSADIGEDIYSGRCPTVEMDEEPKSVEPPPMVY